MTLLSKRPKKERTPEKKSKEREDVDRGHSFARRRRKNANCAKDEIDMLT